VTKGVVGEPGGQQRQFGGLGEQAPLVSVVVPHYRDLVGLDRCLAALGQQTIPAAQFEVVVADNNSPEGESQVRTVVADRARVVIVREPGAGPARNGGVRTSRGEILAFVDSDCVPQADWLAAGLKALPAYDLIGGRVTVFAQDQARMTSAEAFERVFAFDFKTYIQRKGFTGAGNMFCSRKLFDAVGGFRAGVSEDLEWSRRAVAMGYRLGYAPSAIVAHPARRDWEELRRKWRRVNQETFGLYREKPAGQVLWFLRNCLLPISIVAHVPRVLGSDQLSNARDRWLALTMLARIRLWRFGHAVSLLRGQAPR
jgi:GT2 family glycosyltransferase